MEKNKLKAFVRYANNKIVGGSLILANFRPKIGIWKEISTDLCCEFSSTSTTTAIPLSVDIYFIPTADPIVDVGSNVSDWNTFFDLPANGNPFTSINFDIINNIVHLFGGSHIYIRTEIFSSFLTDLLRIVDTSFAIESGQSTALQNNTNLNNLTLFGATSIPSNFASGCVLLDTINLPLVTDIGPSAFANCTSMTSVYLDSCTDLGSSTGDDGVFFGISGNNIQLTVPIALMTINGGLPDGDIQYLMDNNTVTVITI